MGKNNSSGLNVLDLYLEISNIGIHSKFYKDSNGKYEFLWVLLEEDVIGT